VLPEFSAGLTGQVFSTDYSPTQGLAAIATHEGSTWVERQHFYLWRHETQSARRLDLPAGMILEHPVLLRRGDETFVVFGRWQSWALSPLEKLRRYLRSYGDATLRPENSLYLYPLPGGPLTYWGPGHTLQPSPDRQHAVLLRSGALGAGYYSMHLWDFTPHRLTTIVSLREADPGSGRSFDYRWSADSRAVHITGATGGFQRRSGKPRSLNLIYLLGDEALYDLELNGGSETNGPAK
jgi:hypothetical protein